MARVNLGNWIERRHARSAPSNSRARRTVGARRARSRLPRLVAISAVGTLCLLAWVVATARAERVGDAIRHWWSASVGGAKAASNVLAIRYPPLSYAGRDENGIPHYTRRPFSPSERLLLRSVFGVERPERLYLSDSTAGAVILYDTERDCGAPCLVSSYRVGAPSVRRHGESWEAMQKRVTETPLKRFPRSVKTPARSLRALSPVARAAFDSLLTAARAAGFTLRVSESYRSPERQAYLRSLGMTHTATSLHSDRRAIDVVVGNGRLSNPDTRARWVAFRRWVLRFGDGRFRLIGTADSSWDWPHIEIPNEHVGFHSIEQLLDSAAMRAVSR